MTPPAIRRRRYGESLARQPPARRHRRRRLRRPLRRAGLAARRSTSPSSTAATTTCSSRCSTRWRPPASRRPRSPRRSADPRPAEERDGVAGQGRRRRRHRRAGDHRKPARALRLSGLATGARHSYFGHDEWESRARPEEDRRRHRDPRADPAAFERAEMTDDPKRAPQAAHLRGGRRRADRRRDRRRHRRARAQGARRDFRHIDPRRHGSSWSRPGRGCWPTFQSLSQWPRRSWRSLASRCGRLRRSRTATRTASCWPTASRSVGAALSGRPA